VGDYKRTMKKFIKDNIYFWIGLLDKKNRCIKTPKALKLSSLVLSIGRGLSNVEYGKRENKIRKEIYNIIIKGKM